jgi:hypothetical protein
VPNSQSYDNISVDTSPLPQRSIRGPQVALFDLVDEHSDDDLYRARTPIKYLAQQAAEHLPGPANIPTLPRPCLAADAAEVQVESLQVMGTSFQFSDVRQAFSLGYICSPRGIARFLFRRDLRLLE